MHFYDLHFIHPPLQDISCGHLILQFPPAMQQLLAVCLDAGGFTDGGLQAPEAETHSLAPENWWLGDYFPFSEDPFSDSND